MKIFITNKREFDSFFEFAHEQPEKYFFSSEMHKHLYNAVFKSVNCDEKVEQCYLINYKRNCVDGDAIFDFICERNGVYFFEYTGTDC